MGRTIVIYLVAAALSLGWPRPAAAEPSSTIDLLRCDVQGLVHTKPRTIVDLLPRPVPGRFSEDELREFERHVRNLSLFDSVRVTVLDEVLVVTVVEKFTLAPIVNFSTGKTGQDVDVTAGAGEYNIGGGIRVIPTWLSAMLLRVDVARLLAPSEAWLVQTAIAQYF